MNWWELIVVFGGIYLTLMAYRVIPVHLKDPKKAELWHKKFGRLSKVIGPLMILFGLLKLFGII